MIIVPVKDGENIERALKKFKRKFEKTGAIRELRARKNFEKPSVRRRMAKMKAIYVQHLRLKEEQYCLMTQDITGRLAIAGLYFFHSDGAGFAPKK